MAGGGVSSIDQMLFDDCCSFLQEEAINKMADIFEAEEHPKHEIFNSEEYMAFYTVVYDVCCTHSSLLLVPKMYEQYKRLIEEYISSKVLPSMREKSNENLLRELLRRWRNHKIMTKWLSMFFQYLSTHYRYRTRNLPSLVEASHSIFYNMVYVEVKDQIRDIVTSMIYREQIDEATLKEVLCFCEEIRGVDASKKHAKDFEDAIIEATSKFKGLRL